MIGLISPTLAWNAQAPASGMTAAPSCSWVPFWTGVVGAERELERAGHGVERGGIEAARPERLEGVGLGVQPGRGGRPPARSGSGCGGRWRCCPSGW